MIILVDLDDVMINTGEAWVRELNRIHGTTVKRCDIISWNITEFFPSLSSDDVYKPLQTAELWESVSPIRGAAETMQKLIADGHDVYVATASSPDTIGMKWKLVIQRYFSFIRSDHIIVTSSKQMILGDILIDDAPFNLEGGKYKGILFDAPHNKSYAECSNGFVRAKNWDEVYDYIAQKGGDFD